MGFRTRLFLLTLGVVVLTLVSAYAYLAGQTRKDATERARQEMEVRLALVEWRVSAEAAPLDDFKTWDAIADELGQASRSRITLVRADGVVIGDSDVPTDRLPSVENHGHRPEVLQAMEGEVGLSSRASSTVGHELLYLAKLWRRDGEVVGTLRISLELTHVAAAMETVYRQLTIAGVLGLLVAFVGSTVVTHFITTSARRLTSVAQRIAAGDLEARGDVAGGDEFATLAATLNGLADNLKKSLGDLRDERDRMTRVLSSMHEGVLMVDQEGRIQLVNGAAQEMLLLGSHAIGERASAVLRDTELVERLQTALDKGENSSAELHFGPSGRDVLTNIRRLRQRSGALAVLVDITERRRLETVRQEFVANASHELRTPVTAILSAVETIEGAATGDPEAIQAFTGIIGRNALRLAALVNDLLELSQLESQQFQVECGTLELHALVNSSLAGFQIAARDKQVELSSRVPLPFTVYANANGLEHVLGNLLQNAINYCPAGSKVAVGAEAVVRGVIITVADNGPGIPAQHLPRLFERFYRVDTGRSRSVGGTGLGLSIVRHWVEAMGGTVSVTSEVGKGTTFRVHLTHEPEPQSEQAETRTSEPPTSLD